MKADDDNILGAFGEEHAARLTGLSLHQLRRWDRMGFFAPSYGYENRRSPYSRVYSFRDIVALRVLSDLRRDKGVSLQHLKEVSNKLAHLGDAKWTATTLYVLGKRVVFDDPRTNQKQEVVSGQAVLDIPLRVAMWDARKAIRDLNIRGDDVTGKIIRGRFVSENQPVFQGTRIPVAAVQRYLAAGYDAVAIIREYPSLTAADIKAASAYGEGNAAA